MSEKPTKIQRYSFVRSGKFKSVEERPDGDLMLYADHEADVAAQVAEAVRKVREREVKPLRESLERVERHRKIGETVVALEQWEWKELQKALAAVEAEQGRGT